MPHLLIEIVVDGIHLIYSKFVPLYPFVILIDFVVSSDKLVFKLSQFSCQLFTFVSLVSQNIVKPLDLFGKNSEFTLILSDGGLQTKVVRLLIDLLIELCFDSPISHLKLFYFSVFSVVNVF